MSTYTVYKITCLPNNKVYIGYTKNDLKIRLNGHFKKAFSGKFNHIKFFRAIQKYGKINFSIESIKTFILKEEATNYEKLMIKDFNSYFKGYNSTLGGDGGETSLGKKLTEEHKNKISISNKGKKLTEEHKNNISKNHHDVSGENNPMYGKISNGSFKSGLDHPLAKQIIINGILYLSLSDASKKLKMSRETIKKRYL